MADAGVDREGVVAAASRRAECAERADDVALVVVRHPHPHGLAADDPVVVDLGEAGVKVADDELRLEQAAAVRAGEVRSGCDAGSRAGLRNATLYAVPRAALREAFDGVRAAAARHARAVPFPVEVRVAAADDVPLSTASGRDSAYLAVHVHRGLAGARAGAAPRAPSRPAARAAPAAHRAHGRQQQRQ